MRTTLLIVLTCGSVTAAACDSPEPHPTEAPAPEATTPTTKVHMQEHFTRGAAMRDAVIAGDIERIRRDAMWMAEHVLSKDLPETWAPHVASMQLAAKDGRDAQDIETAARSVANVARACGACHASLGGPELEIGEPPPEGSGTLLHMDRHHWAAARMWDALVTPSEKAWVLGTDVMADAPLTPEAVASEHPETGDVQSIASKVHEIAERSRASRDIDQRSADYAEFLGTCAACHGQLENKPGS